MKDLPLSNTVKIASGEVEGGGNISHAATYSIVNAVSSKCADAAGHGTANGTPLQLWDCPAPGRNQQWTFTSTSGGFYTIGVRRASSTRSGKRRGCAQQIEAELRSVP